MSLGDDLLIFLSGHSGAYRVARKKLSADARQYPELRRIRRASDETVRVTLSRLKKRGLVQNDRGVWRITQEGGTHMKKKHLNTKEYLQETHTIKRKKRTMIIVFDIPEHFRKKRDWLRRELLKLGFVMFQKSVWFGPAPLPESLVEVFEQLDMIRYMKFFEVKEADIV